ncbi:hypothetical protein GGD87_003065 [Rhodobaca bogoriensis DSM 18756]|nr:hypothetical protein [Rhodobaca bogoriensis DSM 18756]
MDVSQLNTEQSREALQLIDMILDSPEGLSPALMRNLRRQASLLRQRLND